jgi:hypothetical protein
MILRRLRKAFKRLQVLNLTFLQEFNRFAAMEKTTKKRFTLSTGDLHPKMKDRTNTTGYDKHYIYHSAWAARVVRKINPEVHTDISSILYFSTIVSAFCKINYYDYRPALVVLDNHESKPIDLVKLSFDDNSIQSLSCMHTLEHIGLGRYGDALDYDGDIKAINELKRVMARGGNLLIVLPIGAESKIAFNAHRIYKHQDVLNLFFGFKLKEFALISDNKDESGLIYQPSEEILNRQKYGCGCYWFEKEN